MDFALTDDQQMIRESASRFVADRGRRAPDAAGFDRDLWASMAEMGWLAAGVPEDLGGLGGPIETALIAEELGRGAIGGDFFGAAVLGPQLLIAAGPTPQRDALLEDVIGDGTIVAAAFSEPEARGNLAFVQARAQAKGGGHALAGTKTLVLAGDVADRLIVSARTAGEDNETGGISLFLVDPQADGVTVLPTPLVDGTSAATVSLIDVPGELIGEAGSGFAALRAMAEHGIACMAAESVGMMEAVAEITADYLRTRTQFGQPLGNFQVLQHKLADMAIDAEMARAALFVALASFELDTGALRDRRFSGAKAAQGESLRRVTGAGVQAHGGMGMTIEYPVGRYLQRMVVLDAILGSPDYHFGVCAKSLAA